VSRPGRLLPPGKTRYPLYRRLDGPQGRSGQMQKISSPPGSISGPSSQSLYRLSYPAICLSHSRRISEYCLQHVTTASSPIATSSLHVTVLSVLCSGGVTALLLRTKAAPSFILFRLRCAVVLQINGTPATTETNECPSIFFLTHNAQSRLFQVVILCN
jgi:hypothetical protein